VPAERALVEAAAAEAGEEAEAGREEALIDRQLDEKTCRRAEKRTQHHRQTTWRPHRRRTSWHRQQPIRQRRSTPCRCRRRQSRCRRGWSWGQSSCAGVNLRRVEADMVSAHLTTPVLSVLCER
jgi:hypothetical protein